MSYKFSCEIKSVFKHILLVLFIAASIKKSVAQIALKQERVNVYFQSISFRTDKSIASNIIIYDTYYNKIDSVSVPEEGILLSLPSIDLIFKVRAIDKIYKTEKVAFYANELKDSLKFLIYTKTMDSDPVIIPEVFFKENSFEFDSAAIIQLRIIKKQLLVLDDEKHRMVIQVHSHADVLEKLQTSELLDNRAHAVINFLIQNTKISFKRIYFKSEFFYVEKPITEYDHARNRCVGLKFYNRN